MPVSFNTIPGSGLAAPLLGSFEINSAGAYTGNSRALIVAHKTATGTIAVDTPTLIGSQLDADRLGGAGSQLREMFRFLRQNAPVQEIWAVAPAELGVAQTWTMTIAAPAIGNGVGSVEIAGERVAIQIASTDTTSTIATNLAAAINAYWNTLTGAMLPVTATAAAAVVTLTSRHLGVLFGDLDIHVPSISGSNLFAATAGATVGLTVAAGTAGSGVPSLTASLAAMLDSQYDLVLCPWSDAASLAAAIAAMNDVSGRWSWMRQSYGHVFTASSGTTSALTTLGLSLNDRHLTIIGRPAVAPHPSYLWLAGMVGRVAPWLGDYTNGGVSRNQSNLAVVGLKAPRDRTTWPAYAVRNTLVQSGISTWTVDDFGNVCVDKLVTTNRQGPQAQPDLTFRDVQKMYQLTHALRIIRADIASEHGNKALAETNPDGNPAIVTPADIHGTIVGSFYKLRRAGILKNVEGMAAALRVEIDAATPTRVNAFLALDPVNPLDILAGNATLYALGVPAAA